MNPDPAQPIRGIVVGVPARDEAASIASSIRSLRAAADALGDEVVVRIVLACDACEDRTLELAVEAVGADERFSLISGDWRSAGTSRRAAISVGIDRLADDGIGIGECWIATTDADTVVPPDWLQLHLHYAHDGFDGVAGIVELRRDDDYADEVAFVFEQSYRVEHEGHGHGHVHGANLGVRGGAYEAVGGFPAVRVSEDHALWNALNRAGFRCCPSLGLRVATSGRLHGRAPGGFADTLRERVRARATSRPGYGTFATGETA